MLGHQLAARVPPRAGAELAGALAHEPAVAFAVGFSEAAFVGLLTRLGGSVAA